MPRIRHPRSCGALSLSIEPGGPTILGDLTVFGSEFYVAMKWSDAPNLNPAECSSLEEGYYNPETDSGGYWPGFNSAPYSLWDFRTTTYNWLINPNGEFPVETTWQFRVNAVNCGIPQGPYSTASIFVPGKLNAPTNGTATAGGGKVVLSWTPPAGRWMARTATRPPSTGFGSPG
ncbi:MAG: hypothetical protein FWD69_14800 [Polyangiaceae bacterium]|nr:hypothetical protein [Polyangiaceae bacterium]